MSQADEMHGADGYCMTSDRVSERIGFVGLGRMGQAMSVRLLDAGFFVMVHNRTRAKAADVLARGAVWADSLAELATQSAIVLTILTDDRAVMDVFQGDQGLLAGATDGTLFVEMSTIRPATIQSLRPLVEGCGARLLDAPVSGTLEPARQGQLLVLAGGAESDLEQARPVLEALSRKIVHMGGSGAGTMMKLVLNMPMGIYWAGMAEALSIGRQAGFSVAQMLDIYLDSPVATPMLRGKAALLLGAEQEVGFDIAGVRKDLLAMIANAQDLGVPTPTASVALSMFAAAAAAGYAEHDLASLIPYVCALARSSSPNV